jgi:DNA helicase HerA-like ATPase
MPEINLDLNILLAIAGHPWFLPGLFGGGCFAVLVAAVMSMRGRARRRHQADEALRRTVLLVTVPKESAEKGDAGQREKSLQEIQEDIGIIENIFASLGGLKAERGLRAWWLGRDDAVAFEMVAADGLVSFYVAAPARLRQFIEQQVQAQYHTAQIEEVVDHNIFVPTGAAVGTELKFRRSAYFPIRVYRDMESDPLNAVTNALAKVAKADGAAVQLVVRSAKAGWRSGGLSLVQEMQKGKSLKQATGGGGGGWLGALGDAVSMGGRKPEPAPSYQRTPEEDEMVKRIDRKVGSLGLDATLRVVASAQQAATAQRYLDNIIGAFAQYNIPQYGNSLERAAAGRTVVRDYVYRHFNGRSRMVMVPSELASVFHMPLPSTETPNIRWLLSRKAPPPSNIPDAGLRLGFAEYRGERREICMRQEDRFRHMYLIGKSGSGKSEYIANLAVQDILRGDGVCVIDPHGDLVDTVLACVPKERADDVVIFDPADMERPMALNMLESPSEEMKDFVCGEMIAIFYKLFPPEMIGPMFEHNMRNFMLTLMADTENPGTIAEIPRLISDPAFQKLHVSRVKDPVVRSFWENEMARTSEHQKGEMMGYLISKVGRFVENTMMRNIIGQQRSSFDFRKIMDDRKIFLVKLSKGKIGDINANLLGLIIVTKLQMAVMGRADVPKDQRRDFFLYIDEFQNFITPSIATILSEARKYRISLIIAHQYMGQLSPKGDTEIRDAVLGNVGTMLVGRIGIDDAEVLAKEFQPVLTPYDLINVDKFNWNAKVLVDNSSSRPFTFQSPPPLKGNERIARALGQLSRLKFGRDRSIVEEEILLRTAVKLPPPKPPPPRPAA